MNIKERYKYIIAYFKENNPIAKTELKYDNAFELLVAVILSAQCTDKRVNLLTPSLMTQFPTAKLMSQASIEDIFSFIKTCSYPNNKAKHLLGMATMLTNEFNEIIPSDINELQKLPGVGRKTANVIASVIYNKPTMAVDTHVFRVANRLGLTKAITPLESEKQLVKYSNCSPLVNSSWQICMFGQKTKMQ
jgi:endonuclease-3